MKKLIAMLLCLAVVLSLSAVAFAAEVADIRIEAEKPADKKIDLEFHPYSWDPNSGVDHKSRESKLDADGLQYVYSDKSVINFAAHDAYTYTVDVPAAGTYELRILADSDRDTPIIYTVNGGAEVTGTFLGHTNGAGYANAMEEGVLGQVELVKGTNTLTFTISENKNHNMYTDAYVLVPVTVEEEPSVPEVLPEILKGTPVVDGKLDEIYTQSYQMNVDKSTVIWIPVEDNDDIKATVYFLHDGEYLYVCAEITGDSDIVNSQAASWAHDGIDVWFISPANDHNFRTKVSLDAFAVPYDADNDGVVDSNNKWYDHGEGYERQHGLDYTKIVKAAVRGETSYIVEAKMPIGYYSESEGTVGINIQLNNIYSPDEGSTDTSKHGGYYGKQFGAKALPTVLLLSDAEAVVPETPVEPNVPTGDSISLVVALLAVSGAALVVLKKKEF